MSVKELRERTAAGFLDCKKALDECGGDIEKAIAYLKEKGLAKAAKRAGNLTAEGLVICSTVNGKIGMISIGTETDFVAKNDKVCQFVTDELKNFLNSENDDIKKCVINGEDFDARLAQVSAVMGENMLLRECCKFEAQNTASYLHNQVNETFNASKIGVIVEFDKVTNPEFAKHVAMHIAAFKPEFIDTDSAEATKENTLYQQGFLMDQSLTVKQACEKYDMKILNFKMFL